MRWLLVSSLLFVSVAFAAVNPSPAARTAFDRAEKALEANQLDQAVAGYKEALVSTAGWAPALNGLGSALFKQNKREEAISQFKAAVEADPAFKLGWFNLGYATRKTQDFKTAAAAYEKYTQLDTKDADGFYGLGESYRQLGENAKAIAAYEEFLKKETRPSEQKWIDKAKDAIAQLKAAAPAAAAAPVVAVAPGEKPASDGAPQVASAGNTTNAAIPAVATRRIADGVKLMGEKKYRDAALAFQDAVNADPNNVEALFNLGNAYATLGYYDQAIEKWTKVTQVSPDGAVKKSAADNVARAQQKIAQVGGGSPQAQGKPPGSGPVADTTRNQARAWYEQA